MRQFTFAAGLCLTASLGMAQTGTAPAIALKPATVQIRAGATTNLQTFTVVETGVKTPATTLTWTLSGPAGSAGSLGAITSKGVYTPPAIPPSPNTVTVTATDATNKVSGAAVITVLDPIPAITSLSTTNINTGLAYVVDVKGAGFMKSYQVMLDTAVAASNFVSGTDIQITGTSTATPGTTIAVTVVDPGTGGKTSNAVTLKVLPPVAVTVTPGGRTVRCGGGTLALAAQVTNNSNTAVTWQVNGTATGTISKTGVYAAPADLPAVPAPPAGAVTTASTVPVTITATSVADPTATASLTVNLENPQPSITSTSAGKNGVDPTVPLNLTVNGTGFAQGAQVYFAGTALPTTWQSDTRLTATGTIPMPVGGIAAVKVANPNPGSLTSTPVAIPVALAKTNMAYADAVRFLEMASWGPTPASVVELQTLGRDAWLAKQLDATQTPASTWPDPSSDTENMSPLQDAFFNNAIKGQDQLRQRVAFALSQIMVASGVKDTEYSQMVSYQRLLGDNAFGTFRNLLGAMTLNPAMGYYLDMVNNAKANPKTNTAANENYARESMQLFTLGLVQLNIDGTPVPNAGPEYTQDTVTQMAKVFTGWTYAPEPGYAGGQWPSPAYYLAPMVSFDGQHDMTGKDISLPVPCTLPVNQSAQTDLDAALDCICKQTNVAPFISYRLIQRLVKSNPTPGYVAAVAGVFNSSKGDLGQVVKAILTNEEATTEDTTFGDKLTEPVLYSTTLLRALNASVTDSGSLDAQSTAMGQNAMEPASVFSYFSPFYRIAGTPASAGAPPPTYPAPEFQAVNAATAIARANFAWRAVTNGISGTIKVDLTNLQDLAAVDPNQLVEAINMALYRGEMTSSDSKWGIILAAAKGSTSTAANVRSAVYAAAAAPQFQVQQ
jgi:uncharacterized protein (DUF1800 family)